jgi:hypothetical protein
VPGANGQGETIEEAKDSLRQAIELILEDRKADILRGLPDDVMAIFRRHGIKGNPCLRFDDQGEPPQPFH